MTYNGLRLLDQNSVLALSETFSQRTGIQFIAAKKEIFDYLDKYATVAPIIQTILRTYGGVFDFETKINTLLISKKANTTEKKVIQVLEKMEKDGIIEYSAQHSDIEITFLVPREDECTINVFAKKIKQIVQVKTDHIRQILSYIKNGNTCRNTQILTYFGEKPVSDCGHCDVCLQKKPLDFSIIDIVQQDILRSLQLKKMGSRELIQTLTYREGPVIAALQGLLEDRKIIVNSINQYELYK